MLAGRDGRLDATFMQFVGADRAEEGCWKTRARKTERLDACGSFYACLQDWVLKWDLPPAKLLEKLNSRNGKMQRRAGGTMGSMKGFRKQ